MSLKAPPDSSPSCSSSDHSLEIKAQPRKSVSGPKTREDASFLASTRKRLAEATQSVLETAGRRLRSGNSMDATTCSTTRSTSASTSRSSSSGAFVLGEAEFQSLMNLAEYEIHQDPYRGILSEQQSIETKTSITTPWNACEWGTLLPEPIQDYADIMDPLIVVRHVGNCACPSLKEWTRVALAAKKTAKQRRRKRQLPETRLFEVGLRPEGEDFICPCDYNPLCLATLGGVMNEIIEERCRAFDTWLAPTASISKGITKQSVKTECDDDIQVMSSEVKIVDLAKVESANCVAKKMRPTDDFSDGSDTFAFLEDTPQNPSIQKQPLTRATALLQATKIKPTEHNPAEIFLTSTISQQGLNCIEYSQKTKQALQQARQSVEVDTASIRNYICWTLQILPSTSKDDLTIDRYMRILKDWHERLQFINPVADDEPRSEDRISLAMPPGIRNLGATCYLNTQLQCLAQNLTFLNGIFSWHMVNENHKMNSVMSKLQLLLAQMFLGGQCKVTTLDFSNALGLEHHEQQDPNEFARLLFDRMDESFQQCDNDGDLSNLLNKIFHGVTTYETICMTCGTSSERSEGFMDLNLPIVKPATEPKKPTVTIAEVFASSREQNVDTDVQYCLDQYTCEEMLDGENQYLCSTCNCKRDAKRILKLSELPPVLNIQLSRYVFDRTKFVKKKISDKVLLPTTLTVQTGDVAKKKYMLCAVMRHQGNSAYSGHYLAEAMDWLTGTWFEFNDETVKLLPDGPSSSFDPVTGSSLLGDNGSNVLSSSTVTKHAGSQDAYNMYYVEEGYLAQSAKSAILWQEQRCKLALNGVGVLGEINNHRKEEYVRLAELCITDAEVSDRLNRRRVGIRKYMLPNAQALVRPKSDDMEIGAWVSTDFLIRYLRCQIDPELDSLLRSSYPVMRNTPFLCEHQRLSPETARTGKLLPIPLYESLISLLRGERGLLQQESDLSIVSNYQIEDCLITPSKNLICAECSEKYRGRLSRKLDDVRAAKGLFDALDTKNDDASLDYDEGNEPILEEDMFVYAVSKQTATKFRRRVAAMIKTVARYDGGGKREATPSTYQHSIYEGLTAMDISSIAQYDVPGNEDVESKTESLDRFFNSNITCSHGNCNVLSSSRQIRYVTSNVWKLVTRFFPEAIQHKRRRGLKIFQITADHDCIICRDERESIDNLKHSIQAWASSTREDPALKSLLERKRTLAREHDVCNFTNANNGCRLVHKADITTWREAVTTLSNAQRIPGNSCDQIRTFAENLAFPSYHKVVLEFENEPIDMLVASIRSFICREHDMVVANAILGDCRKSGDVEVHKLASYVTVVTKDEYHAYITSLATLLRTLRTNVGEIVSSTLNAVAIDQEKSFIGHVRQAASMHHPLIRTMSEFGSTAKNSLKFIHDGSVKEFYLSPPMCHHDTCKNECAFLAVAALEEKEKDDDHIENISVDSLDTRPTPCKSGANLGSGHSDPIVVESDVEDNPKAKTFNLRVFGLEAGATQGQALEALQHASVLPNDVETKNELRRSTRKRKLKYPCGVITREDSVQVSLDHNMAAICLFMYESCSIPANYSKLYLVLTPEFQTPLVQETNPFESEFQMSLSELIQRMRDGRLDDEHFDHKKHTILLHQRDLDASDLQHEALVEALFQSANIGSENATSNDYCRAAKSQKKSRPSERGFQGTLLQSGIPPPPYASNEDDDSVIQGHPEAPAISDDERQTPSMIVDDTSRPSSPPSSRPSCAERDQMVLSDDSGDDSSVSKSPTPPGKKVSLDSMKDPISIVDIFDAECEGTLSRDKLSMEVFDSLKLILPRPDVTKAWDAVLWALGKNPAVNDAAALLDIAFAKYLSNDEPQ